MADGQDQVTVNTIIARKLRGDVKAVKGKD